MKNKSIFILSLIIFCSLSSASKAQSSDRKEDSFLTSDTIHIYYFHFTHRCKTCLAVEEETKAALRQLYPEPLESGIITFQSLNLDKKEVKPIVKKLRVSGQTLLVTQKDKHIDLTREGFLYALTRPDKLDNKIKEVLDYLLYR